MKISKSVILIFSAGLLTSLFISGAIRFITYSEPKHTHHHANFGLFIDDKQWDFSKAKYMEEVSMCHLGDSIAPRQRVHLHSNVGDIVHVHHEGATWGHFFSNLGFTLGDTILVDDTGKVYQEDVTNKLRFILNGSETDSIYNKLVNSKDRLLIDYSADSKEKVIGEKYSRIAQTAEEYNRKPDPATCSGPEDAGFWARVKQSFF